MMLCEKFRPKGGAITSKHGHISREERDMHGQSIGNPKRGPDCGGLANNSKEKVGISTDQCITALEKNCARE